MSSSIRDALCGSDREFQALRTTEERLRFLLHYAVLAPSNYNSQPWRVLIRHDRIELHVDNSRALRFTDPDRRELTISCGAFLFHLRLAMRRFGFVDEVEVFPRLGDLGFLARVGLGQSAPPTARQRALFDAIARRHTNRLAFSARRIPDEVMKDLESAAESEGVNLRIVEDDASRDALFELIVLADRVLVSDSGYRRELVEWIRTDAEPCADGIPEQALGIAGLFSSPGSRDDIRLDVGVFHAVRDRQLSRGAPVLAILSTESDAPEDWLNAGQALDAVLLLASTAGVGASFLNAPLEVADLRPRVMEAIDSVGTPQVILRLGYGPEPPATPRRRPGEIIVSAPEVGTNPDALARES